MIAGLIILKKVTMVLHHVNLNDEDEKLMCAFIEYNTEAADDLHIFHSVNCSRRFD